MADRPDKPATVPGERVQEEQAAGVVPAVLGCVPAQDDLPRELSVEEQLEIAADVMDEYSEALQQLAR